MESSGRGHRHGISRALLPPVRPPHFQVDLPASNSRRANGVCRFGLADLSVTAARKLSIPLQRGLRLPEGRFVDAVVPRDGRERFQLGEAGEPRIGTRSERI